jgi:deoxyribonuclease-2
MNISALNEDCQPVDWWFAHKLPTLPLPPLSYAESERMDEKDRNAYEEAIKTSAGEAQGTEYLYCDANSPALSSKLSTHPNILKSGALVNTIQQLREAAQYYPQVGWFSYNDEHAKRNREQIPFSPADNPGYGHTKGVLAFDLETDTAFWMLHSWPCYPSISNLLVDLPSLLFGQTFLCITLKDVSTADAIASVFHSQSQPQIINMNLPQTIDPAKYPNLVQLAHDLPPATVRLPVPQGSSTPSDTTFTSKNGTEFRLFAKSKDWIDPATDKVQAPKDLYSDFIGPALCVDLEVETWQAGDPDQDSDQIHTTEDIQWIDLSALGLNYAWHFLDHDHSKWAVSRDLDKKEETDWVIVADINRIQSQYKRGGVGIAFQNPALAHSLHSIIRMVPPQGNSTATDTPSTRASASGTTNVDGATKTPGRSK